MQLVLPHLVPCLFLTLTVCLFLCIDEISAAAGYCYQCNSRNPKCGIDVDPSLKRDATPCNGQCYTRINRDDGNVISRGCSWEHGFMSAQATNTLILKGNSVWTFCDTRYCNFEATGLLNSVCFQPICNFLTFPEDCKLPNVDVTCGRFCGNRICGARPAQRRKRSRTRNQNRYIKQRG